jgi:hypothetical protein
VVFFCPRGLELQSECQWHSGGAPAVRCFLYSPSCGARANYDSGTPAVCTSLHAAHRGIGHSAGRQAAKSPLGSSIATRLPYFVYSRIVSNLLVTAPLHLLPPLFYDTM